MVLGFVILYRLEKLDSEKAREAKEKWEEFVKNKWPSEIKLIGDYHHAFGSDFNGFLFVEAPSFESFERFYRIFRDYTRWYLTGTYIVIGVKEE
jgi:hypothetical protein